MEKKRQIILAQIFFIMIIGCIIIGDYSPAFGEERINQRFQLNANNWRGYIDINLDGQSLSGSGVFLTDPKGNNVRQRFWLERPSVSYFGNFSIKIVFQRSNSEQVYHGWISVDRRLIAGYFTSRGNNATPWLAIY